MIELSEDERKTVEGCIRRGKANARNMTRAHILLKSAEGWTIERIAETYGVSEAAVSKVRVLTDKVQQHRRHAFGGEGEAMRVAIASSPVPAGHDHWTLRMLRDKLIELDLAEHVSAATIQDRLKKEFKPWPRQRTR